MEKYYQSQNISIIQTNTGANNAALSTNHKYKGVLHPDSLLWCHGSIGLEHDKIKKFRYPFYKYSHTEDAQVYRIVICVCRNCNMIFYDESARGVSLSIPVRKLDSYTPYEIIVSVNGKQQSIKGELVTPFRKVTQEEIIDETREFIERVQ